MFTVALSVYVPQVSPGTQLSYSACCIKITKKSCIARQWVGNFHVCSAWVMLWGKTGVPNTNSQLSSNWPGYRIPGVRSDAKLSTASILPFPAFCFAFQRISVRSKWNRLMNAAACYSVGPGLLEAPLASCVCVHVCVDFGACGGDISRVSGQKRVLFPSLVLSRWVCFHHQMQVVYLQHKARLSSSKKLVGDVAMQ